MSTCRRIKGESRYRAPLKRYRERDVRLHGQKAEALMNGFLLTIQVEGEKYTDEMEAIFIHVSQLPSVSTKFHAMTQTRFQNVHPCHLSRICLYYATVGPRARTETLARARPEL